MYTNSRLDQFQRDGFICVPGVLTPEQVAQTRAFLLAIFDAPARHESDFDRKGDIGSVRMDCCARYPELRWLLLHPPLVGALRDLLGDDFVILPDIACHDSGYGDWHKDTNANERAGLYFHRESDFRMVECAVYFQDNTSEYGGGLDVVPGSHVLAKVNGRATLATRARRWLEAKVLRGRRRGAYSTPRRAGDLVLFDYRLDHKASWPRVKPVPPEHRKLAWFAGCSANNQHAASYTAYLRSRPDYNCILQPDRYPAEFVRDVEAQRLTLL